jgi:AcrR family transcriptional regulator
VWCPIGSGGIRRYQGIVASGGERKKTVGKRRQQPERTASDAPPQTRRGELLERVADHLLAQGIARFSLRSAAELVGTSARMLVHHFGSKEQLLSEALSLVRTRQLELVANARTKPVAMFDQVFHDAWRILAGAEYRSYFLLNHELIALALREPRRYRAFLKSTTEEWRSGLSGALLAQGCSPEEASALSTMYLATLRGVLLDLAVTGDAFRVEKAIELVAAKLRDDLTTRSRS